MNINPLTIKVPNNKYNDCPALMADGRQFTDYRANSQINMNVMEKKNLMSNYEYRNFLIKNGNSMIDNDRIITQEKNECIGCDAPTINSRSLCKTNVIGQMCEPFDINGIGTQSIAVRSKRVPTISQLNNSIGDFNMFLETNLTQAAAKPGIMCRSCNVKK